VAAGGCLVFLIQYRSVASELDASFRKYAARHCSNHLQARPERLPTLQGAFFVDPSDPETTFRERRRSVEVYARRKRDRFADKIASLMSPLLAAVYFGLTVRASCDLGVTTRI